MRKAFEAWPKLKLAGKRTVIFGRSKEKLSERILQDGPRIRIESSNGVITVLNGPERTVYDPAKNEIFTSHNPFGMPGFGFLPPPQAGPRRTMKFTETDGGKVADRRTRLVVATGAKGEETMRMYVDSDKGAVLRLEMTSPNGNLVMSFEYQAVKYDVEIPARAFVLNYPNAKVVTVRDEVIRLAAKMGIKPYVISRNSGLRLDNSRVFEADGRKVMRQTYVGERTRVSLFLCNGSVSPERLGKFGGGRLRSRVWTVGDLTLVLVGDVEEADLARLQQQVQVEQRG
ncbi:MAG: hypothetical protein JSS65_11935 [Armatimonadetes bacterium]|nr:hypothetical protein [Armatimonadota bacterium]